MRLEAMAELLPRVSEYSPKLRTVKRRRRFDEAGFINRLILATLIMFLVARAVTPPLIHKYILPWILAH